MTAFTDFLADFQSEKIFLCQLDLYDIAAAAPVTLYYSSHGFTTEPADTPPNTHYASKLTRPLDFQRSLTVESRFSGLIIQSGGSIKLNNRGNDGVTDDTLDAFNHYASQGWRVRVWLGTTDFALSDFGLIADLITDGHDIDDDAVTINLRAPEVTFDRELQTVRFAGTGGAEGGSDVANRLKPQPWGICRNISPVYLGFDTGKHEFACSDGAIIGVLRVLVAGIPLTYNSGVPGAGEYTVDVTTGVITLGGSYTGTLTADVIGRRYLGVPSVSSIAVGTGTKTFAVAPSTGLQVGMTVRVGRTSALGSTWMDGVVSSYTGTSLVIAVTSSSGAGTFTDWTISPWGTVAGIVRQIAANFGIASFDNASFTAIDVLIPATVKLWIASGGNGTQVLDTFLKACGCFAGFDLSRQFEIGRANLPISPTANYTDTDVMKFDAVRLGPPPYEIVVTYRQNNSVLSLADLAGGVTDADRAFFLNEWRRTLPRTNNPIRTAFPQSDTVEVESAFDDSTGADAFSSWLADMFGVFRRQRSVTFKAQPLAHDLNQTINLVYARQELSAGANMLIMDVSADMDLVEVTLGLWY